MPQQPFLALITPVSEGGGGGPPLGTWGGVGQPYPDQGLPGQQPGGPPGIWGGPWQPPYPSQGPGFPTHPIAPGGPPLGTWGGVGQPYPDQGLPGQQPGGPVRPDNSLPGQGLGTWGGANQPFPTPPIYIPPQAPPVDPSDPQKAYLIAYVPKSDGSGYERITFSIEVPETPTEPTPKAESV